MHALLSNVFVFGLGKGVFKEPPAFWQSSWNTLTFPCLQSSRSLDLEGSGSLFVVKSTKDVGLSNGPLKNGMPPFTLGFIWRGLSVGCWVFSCYSWWFLVCLQYLEGLEEQRLCLSPEGGKVAPRAHLGLQGPHGPSSSWEKNLIYKWLRTPNFKVTGLPFQQCC